MAKNTVKQNTYPHVKIVVAGCLTTNSTLRQHIGHIYAANYPGTAVGAQMKRNDAVMRYLRLLGVPREVTFDSLSALFATVYPGDNEFPIALDYDEDNCDYAAIIKAAALLDAAVAAGVISK